MNPFDKYKEALSSQQHPAEPITVKFGNPWPRFMPCMDCSNLVDTEAQVVNYVEYWEQDKIKFGFICSTCTGKDLVDAD